MAEQEIVRQSVANKEELKEQKRKRKPQDATEHIDSKDKAELAATRELNRMKDMIQKRDKKIYSVEEFIALAG